LASIYLPRIGVDLWSGERASLTRAILYAWASTGGQVCIWIFEGISQDMLCACKRGRCALPSLYLLDLERSAFVVERLSIDVRKEMLSRAYCLTRVFSCEQFLTGDTSDRDSIAMSIHRTAGQPEETPGSPQHGFCKQKNWYIRFRERTSPFPCDK
jgi:hypothetical protein